MAHITLTHPDLTESIRVPASKRDYFLNMGWQQIDQANQAPTQKSAVKSPVKPSVKQSSKKP